MTQTLENILIGAKNKEYATQTGTQKHAIMRHVVVDEKSGNHGASDIVAIIQNRPDLKTFFAANAQTEVPIAGYINNHFISRRIDRLLINHENKTIDFIDYKTDTDKTTFVDQYKYQLNEYVQLLKSAYPDYKITGYILWLNDWSLDKIILKK